MKVINDYLLVKLKGSVKGASKLRKLDNERIYGEMVLLVREKEDKSVDLILNQLTWFGMGLRGDKKHTGKISAMVHAKRGKISKRKGNSMSFSVETEGEITYKAIEDELGVIWLDKHMSTIPTEKFRFNITGRITKSTKAKAGYLLKNLSISMAYMEGGLGLVQDLIYVDKSPALARLAKSTSSPTFGNLGNCHPDLEVNPRTLTIQPVGFRVNAADPSPTGTSLAVQMAAATTIWGKCCIQFNVLPITYVNDAALKTSSNLAAIRASFTSPTANVIEVFFVDNNLAGVGGGVANSCNSALGNIVMSDNNAGNPQLLSHELGHILGLTHPGLIIAGCVEPDTNTVMQPSGSPQVPNSTNNSHWNCIGVANPALVTDVGTTCCLTHDIPDTMIRDFPEDVGTEPNPGFAGRNFYSMSNVWNRKTLGAGGLNPDGTPEHENPSRFEADGVTPHINFLYAKVDSLNNILVRNAEVRFYLKHPGSGSGAIQFLGAAPIAGLNPGSPQTVNIQWTVPPGTPGHSCTFSVVHSPAEPAEDPTNLTWAQSETLVRDDNDWAQRNLNIDELFPNIGNNNPSQVSLPPIFIEYPVQKGLSTVPLSINLEFFEFTNAIEQVELYIPKYEKKIVIEPGKSRNYTISKAVRPGTQIVIEAKAIVNTKKMKFGEQIDVIGMTPTLGENTIVGYGYSVRLNKSSEAINQVLDRGLGALTDLGEITGLQSVEKIHGLLIKLRRGNCTAPETIVEHFKDYADTILVMQKEVSKLAKAAYLFANAKPAFNLFFDQINEGSDIDQIFDSIRNLLNHLELMNWKLYEKI